MNGVLRAAALLAAALLAATACSTKKAVPVNAGEPHTQILQLEEVPRHVDEVMSALQAEMLAPVRVILRQAPVSTNGVASDGSYTKWLTEVSESLVSNNPLPNNFAAMSSHAYEDLARIAGRKDKKGDPITPDLGLLARRLHVYFETQPAEVRKTAAAYIETAYSIPG